MPRWLQILLCLVLFAGAMLLVRAALQATVPEAVDWAASYIGIRGVLALMLVAFVILGAWVLGEHRRQRSASGS